MSDVRLETREQRRKLAPAHEPYWRSVSRGLALGYRKSPEGGQWYLRRYAGRGYHKRVLGETDDAFPSDGVSRFSWHDVLRTALAETPHDPEFRASYTVRMAFEDYFRNRRARARSAESVRFDEGKVSPFVEKFSGHRVADLTSTDLQRWRDGLIPAPSGDRTVAEADVRESKRAAQATANRVWASVRAMLNHAFSHGRVESDLAWRRVKSFSDVDQPRTRFLSVKEAQALLKHASADFRDLAHAALVSGLRLGELTRLTAGAVNEGRLHVGEGKTGRGRSVPLTDEGRGLFARLADGKGSEMRLFLAADGLPWTRPKVSRRMADASKDAKLDPVATFHDLRRSYGSLLANAGARDAVIALALGHSDTRMTRRHYAHLLDSSVAAELEERLPRFTGVAPKQKRDRK